MTTSVRGEQDPANKEFNNFDISDHFPYIMHLDFFGGISSASIILESLGVDCIISIAWEKIQHA